MDVHDYQPILITGASGQFGQLVLSYLIDEYGVPPESLIATTRNAGKLAYLADRGIEVRNADFDDPDSLNTAFIGANRVLVISTTPEAPYVFGKRFRQQKTAIDAAVKAGAKHIFYTSAPNPEPGTPCYWKEDHYNTEVALRNSGVDWTILRNWEWPGRHFRDNWLPALESGEYFTAAGEGRISHTTRENSARAAAGALVSDKVANKRFDITGPEALTADEIMETLGELAGKKIKVVHVSLEDLEKRLPSTGLDPVFVPIFVAISKAVREGLFDGVTDHAEILSGREQTPLRDFMRSELQERGLLAST